MLPAPLFTNPIELTPGFAPRPQISHVIFDFDGTLSWLPHGWPEIMLRLFREHYPALPGEPEPAIHDLFMTEILALNGKQSIYQMERFVELAHARDASPPSATELLHEYQRRLDEAIHERSQTILRGQAQPDEFVVHGARAFVEKLASRGLALHILSGTVEPRVKQEAELLDLSRYFGPRIHGSPVDHAEFSKRMIIDRLLHADKIPGAQLLSIGDGPVEIAQAKAVGGVAIAVASDEEHNGSGRMDPYKHAQLLKAGADAVVADFRDADALIEMIFGG